MKKEENWAGYLEPEVFFFFFFSSYKTLEHLYFLLPGNQLWEIREGISQVPEIRKLVPWSQKYILTFKKDKIVPFGKRWITLEVITVSEIRKRKIITG